MLSIVKAGTHVVLSALAVLTASPTVSDTQINARSKILYEETAPGFVTLRKFVVVSRAGDYSAGFNGVRDCTASGNLKKADNAALWAQLSEIMTEPATPREVAPLSTRATFAIPDYGSPTEHLQIVQSDGALVLLDAQLGRAAPVVTELTRLLPPCANVPLRNHYFGEGPEGGALYEVRHGVLFFGFARPQGAVTTLESGYISRYSVRDDKVTDYPSASIMFVTAPNLYPGVLIALSYPLTINGQKYECPANTTSAYAAKFHVCPSLPPAILGKTHTVQIEVYRVPYPGGGWTSATDKISTIAGASH